VVGAIRSARSIGRPGIASLVVVQLLVAPADGIAWWDLGAVAVLAELADEPRADQRFAADLGGDPAAAADTVLRRGRRASPVPARPS
jgi:hypothetical protein